MTGTNPWFWQLRRVPQPPAHVLFFPHAGGAATFYQGFDELLPPGIDVSAIQYPGRQERHGEPFVTTVEGLADQIVQQLRPLVSTPLVLFGHSMGAAVAFEVASRLARLEEQVSCRLVVSGRRAPSRKREEHVHRGSDEEVLAEIRRLGGTRSEFLRDPDVAKMILPAIRNDYRAIELYRPDPNRVLNMPILCLTGDKDPKVTEEEATAWRLHTTAEFQREVFSGGHFFLTEHRIRVCRSIERFAFPGKHLMPQP